MHSVTVYNTDSIKARDILARVPDEDVLTETVECVGKVYIEQCFFDMKRRFDGGLGDLELRIIGTVKELFIEDYDDRQFPCNTKNLNFTDAEPVIVNMQLTAKEKGHLFEYGVDHPGFEPPANMKYNTMEIPMLIEYKGIYESPVCFARIIRPNEIQTSTKKCGYYGLFDLVAKHPDVVREEENGGIDINLTKSSPELRMAMPEKTIADQRIAEAAKVLGTTPNKEQEPENKSVAAVRETITERMNAKPADSKASETTVHIYHEAVEEYTEKSDVKDATNVSDIDSDGNIQTPDNVIPYTVRKMDSGLYDVLSQKVGEHAEKVEQARKDGKDIPFNAEVDSEKRDSKSASGEFGDEDKSLSKAEREKKRQINIARRADIAADNKALNADANADISGQGASTAKKTSAQELLGDIMGNSQKTSSGQQFL